MPLTVPANLSAAYLIQTHLAAAITHVHGHDLDSERVRTAILLCLLGNVGTEVLENLGITIKNKYTMALIQKIPVAVIHQINKKAGFQLVAKYGTKHASITLTKGTSFVGGAIGGTVDAVTTKAAGTFADKFFQPVDQRSSS